MLTLIYLSSSYSYYIYFTLSCRGLGLVGLALYLVDWPTVVLQCFDAVGWVIWPVKIVSDMTYNVFGVTLNPTLLLQLWKVTDRAWKWVCAALSILTSSTCARRGCSIVVWRSDAEWIRCHCWRWSTPFILHKLSFTHSIWPFCRLALRRLHSTCKILIKLNNKQY